VASAALRDDTVLEAAIEEDIPTAVEADIPQPEAKENLSADILHKLSNPGDSSEIDEDQLAALSVKKTTKPFMLAGITWAADSDVEVVTADARLLEDGEWTEWTSLELLPAQEGDKRAGTEPIVSPNATGVQVRVLTTEGTTPKDLEVTLVDPGESDNDNVMASDNSIPSSAEASQSATALKPKVVPRETWMGAGDAKLTTWTQDYSARLDAMYVHHTAGSNTYGKSDGAKIVRSVYTYHAKTLGWGDIGYQFLVDKYGNIFEGRHDAIESLPVGAQAAAYNTGTIGVSALGNYETAQPTAELIEALTKVLAWKAYEHGLDPLATTRLLTGAGSSARAKTGTYVTVPTILGHRDTNATACPGKNLYPRLAAIRADVAKRVNATTATYGSYTPALATPKVNKVNSVILSDKVTISWDPVPGATRYHVMTRLANKGSALGADNWWALHKNVTTSNTTLTFADGQTRYVAVRAVNATGHSFPVKVAQITRPVAATTAKASSGWTNQSATAHYSGTARRATTTGRTLDFGSVAATRKVAVVGSTGPSAGNIEVLVDGKVRGTLNFNAGTAKNNVIKTLDLGQATKGNITLRTAGTGSSWMVAGVAFQPVEQGAPKLPDSKSPTSKSPSQGLAVPSVTKLPAKSAPVQLHTTATYRWKKAQGAVAYEIGIKQSNFNRAVPTKVKIHAKTTKLSYKLKIPAGHTVRAYVRSVGSDGKTSKWAALGTINRPPTTKHLIRTTGAKKWTKPRDKRYYRGYVLQANKKGATIKVNKVKGVKRVAVTVSTAPNSGNLAVYAGKTRVKTLSLTSQKTVYQKRFIVNLPKTYSGTISLKSMNNKPVRVSAVTLLR
jgi:hypothetical protein